MKKIIYSLLAILLLNACSRDAVYPELRNTVIGEVIVRNEFGTRIPDQTGVTVTLDVTDFSAMTDENGVFEITDVLRGNYRVRFQKEGYNDYFVDIEVRETGPTNFNATDQGSDFNFVAPSTLGFDTFDFVENTSSIDFDVEFSEVITETDPGMVVFVSSSEDVSNTSYERSYSYRDFDNDGDIDNSDGNRLFLSNLRSAFGDEATVYLVAYPASTSPTSHSYIDTTTGLNIYYPLNNQPSEVFTLDLTEDDSDIIRQ
ncbi:MAG: carboxypeptidase-like regulatory domain-containing protein [Thermonemataceae bacterium]